MTRRPARSGYDRRSALRVLSVAGGGAAALAAAVPVARSVLDAAGRPTVTGIGELVPVAELEAIPEDGTPVSFPVVIPEPGDGWNRLPPTEVGSVWLLREGPAVRAFSTVCPHLGCGVDWSAAEREFVCRCHDSWFSADGAARAGPSPRGLDELETKLEDGVVRVRFLRFALNVPEQRPA